MHLLLLPIIMMMLDKDGAAGIHLDVVRLRFTVRCVMIISTATPINSTSLQLTPMVAWCQRYSGHQRCYINQLDCN